MEFGWLLFGFWNFFVKQKLGMFGHEFTNYCYYGKVAYVWDTSAMYQNHCAKYIF